MKTHYDCPVCSAEWTIWTGLRSASPLRFRCPNCDSRFVVRMPRMGLFIAVVVAFTLFLMTVCIFAGVELEPNGLFYSLAALAIYFLALEAFTSVLYYTYAEFVLTRRGEIEE